MRIEQIVKRATLGVLGLPLAMLLANCSDHETSGTGGSSAASSGSGTSSTTGSTSSSGAASSSSTGAGGGTSGVVVLDPTLTWYGDNRERLDAMIQENGKNSKTYDPKKMPVAIFDWDNTVIKNDVGDATVFWMLAHDKILQPPMKNWALTSPYLTSPALMALNAACDANAAEGQALKTSTDKPCADEILSIYYTGVTTGKVAAFNGFDYRTIEPAYAWAAQLLGGLMPSEAHTIADAAIDENLKAPVDDKQTIGNTMGLTHWLRIYDQIKDLIDVFQKNGFDVWVVSASPQYVVERIALQVNVMPDHVIGIRPIEAQGKITYNLQGCGTVPDGTNDGAGNFTGNSLITYIDGKRCWVNKVIFKTADPMTQMTQLPQDQRQVFAAGDSNTDITFVRDATKMKLVLNRNKTELMCHAYRNYGGTWLINPMFIEPKGQLVAGYPCSTIGCFDKFNMKIPCLDEADKLIPDQADNVY